MKVRSVHKISGLMVHEMALEPYDGCPPKQVFIAFRNDDDVSPRVVATAVVTDSEVLQYIEYLEVAPDCRRMGYGTALMSLILRLFPDARYEPATDDGDAFCEAFNWL